MDSKINPAAFITCLSLLSFLMLFAGPAAAESPMDKLSEIQNSIMNKLQQVKDARKKEASISTKIDSINENITRKEKDLKQYDKRISTSKTQIRNLSNELNSLDRKLEERNRYLNERIIALYKRRHGGNAFLLISAADYQDLIRKSKYVSLIAHYDGIIIRKYSSDIKEIHAKKNALENINTKLNKTKESIRKKKEELQTDRMEKDKLFAVIKSKRLAQESKIRELKESSRKLQNMVRELKGEGIPDSILGKGFKASKGDLPWPVNGSIVIPYGNYNDPDLNTTIFKNGIEIMAGEKDKIKAVAGGRVVFANKFEGFGTLMIIDHGGGYHSLYGNISEVALKAGELLIEGMDIGIADNSKKSNTPSLYFEIRYKGKPVDPIPWLKQKNNIKL